MTRSRIVFFALVFVLLATVAKTCVPDFPALVFTRKHGPDGPISAFTQGKIGIPLPDWWRPYLVVAYRYLENKPLSHAEAKSFADFWGIEHDYGFPADPAKRALNKWLKVRQQYPPRIPRENLKPYKEEDFNYNLNCTFSAFVTATDTLRSRAQHFGDKSKELQQWIAGQDAVFENCDGNHKQPVFPEPLPVQADPLLRADRAYQTAATYFYTGNYQRAASDFDAIGKDAASPWQPIAPYLAVRAMLRQVSANSEQFDYPDQYKPDDLARLKESEHRLQAIINDPSRKQWHHDARKLLNFIAFRIEPLQYQHRLAAGIIRGGESEDFGQNVKDYTLLLDKQVGQLPDFAGVRRSSDEYEKKLEQWRHEQYKIQQADDLSDWILTFQSDSQSAKQHAIKKWRTSRTIPWLYLALAKLNGTDSESSEAIQAAGKIVPESPLFAALNYHCARLLKERGDWAGAREVLEKIVESKQNLSLSTINLIQDEQTKLSPDRKSFILLLARQPVAMTYAYFDDTDNGCYGVDCNLAFYGLAKPPRGRKLELQFDSSTGQLLNTAVPTEELVRIVNEKALPASLQRRLATAVWARAALLDQPDLAASIADAVIAGEPELKRFTEELAAAKSPEERRFVAAFAIAHFPGLRPYVDTTYPRETAFVKIDSYRDNWWCKDVGVVSDLAGYEKQWRVVDEPGVSPSPAFLTREQTQTSKTEWKNLRSIGTAEEHLPKTLIGWAKTHPDDPRVPEALHFSWRVSRYGCGLSDPKHYNRQVFDILHKRYPNSEWTKKTKYWFKRD